MHRGENAPVGPVGGEWRGVMAQRVRERVRDGPLQPPAGPLLWEHTEPNEFDSLLSSINHAMQNISPF